MSSPLASDSPSSLELRELLQESTDPVGQMVNLIQAMAPGVILANEQGQVLYWNPAARRLHGYGEGDSPPNDFRQHFVLASEGQLLPPDDWPVDRLRRGETVVGLELEVRRQDCQQTLMVRYDGTRIPRGDAAGDLLMVTMTDLTEVRRAECDLKKSEQMLRILSDCTEDAIFIKDRGGTYQLFNQAAGRFVGRDPLEVVGRDDTYIFPAEDAALLRQLDLNVMESGIPTVGEEHLMTSSGARTFLASKAPYRDDLGNVAGLVGVSRDVSHCKQMQEELQAERVRFTRLAEIAPGALHTFHLAADGRYKFLYCSPSMQAIYDIPPEALLEDARVTLERIHPEDRSKLQETMESSARERRPWHCIYRIAHPEKGEIWIEGSSSCPVPDGQGGMIWHGILVDITAHKLIQAEYRAERQRFEDIVASVPGAIYSFLLRPDGSMQFPYASPYMERLFPVRLEEIREDASPVFAAVSESFHAELFESIRKSAETLQPWTGTVMIKDPEKGETWVEGYSMPRRLEDGSIIWHGVLTDISERRSLEQQFWQAQKMEAVGRLAGGVAHDFNNLLTVINGYSDMALAELEPDHPHHTPLQQIREAGERSARLTRQLLAFSRRAIVEPKIFDVNSQLRELQKMLKRLIGEDLELSFEPCQECLPVLLDTGQFEQMVLNLVVNARDAMPRGGRITLSTSRGQDEVQLTVRDTGCGMTREVLARIYEPFFTTKGVGKGTGLGLAVVHGVVTGGNGRLEVESRPTEGTEFRIYFPLSLCAPPRVPLTSRRSFRGTETILLAEDELEVRRVLLRGLESQGYKVLVASNGFDAIRVASEYPEPIHLLLTDVVMPEMGGPDAAERIQEARPDIKVMFMTGYTEDERIPANILQKPLTPHVVAEKVRQLLDAPAVPAE